MLRQTFRRSSNSSMYGPMSRLMESSTILSWTIHNIVLDFSPWSKKVLASVTIKLIWKDTSHATNSETATLEHINTRDSSKTSCSHSSLTSNIRFCTRLKMKSANILSHLSLWSSQMRPHSLCWRGTRWISGCTSKSTERPASSGIYCFRFSLGWESCIEWDSCIVI